MGDFQQIKAAIVTRDPAWPAGASPAPASRLPLSLPNLFAADLRRLE
jgi:hypothetical protein